MIDSHFGRFLSVPVTAVAAFLVVLALAVPATADGDGDWYLDRYEIDSFHAAGIDGSGVTIAVIDEGINTHLPEFSDADIEVREPSYCYGPDGAEAPADTEDIDIARHGTNVVGTIVGNGKHYTGDNGTRGVAPGAKILFYGVGPIDAACLDADGSARIALGLGVVIDQAVDDGADIISISVAAPNRITESLANAYRAGVIVVAAVSNQGEDDVSGDSPPVTNNGVIGVSALRPDNTVMTNADGDPLVSDYVDVVAPGVDIATVGSEGGSWNDLSLSRGTSYAAPIVAANLALAMQKYPDATPNQMIQSLVRNTDVEPHELYFDHDGQFGFGVVNTISLLAADPTEYADVNPLLVDVGSDPSLLDGPSLAQVFGESSPSPSPSASPITSTSASSSDPTPSATTVVPAEKSDSNNGLMPVLISVLILIAVGATALAIVFSKRRTKEADHGTK